MIKLKSIILPLLLLLLSTVVYSQTASLADYLEIAVQNNPGLKAEFLNYQASLQKIPQAGAIPDPQLEMGFYVKPMNILDGSQLADFTLMQMFPWFGTRKLARVEANYMANMAFEKFRESRDNLYLAVYTKWFLLCSLQQKLTSSQENKQYLEQLKSLAIRKYSSPVSTASGSTTGSTASTTSEVIALSGGMAAMSTVNTSTGSGGNSGTEISKMDGNMNSISAGMSEVLRLQLEIVELETSIESFRSEIEAEKAKFNTLLNRPTNSGVSVPDNFEKISYLLNVDKAMELIEQQNPMLGMLKQEANAYKAKQEMDKQMSYPMLGVGFQYSVLKKRMDMGIPVTAMNGMDMVMPMLSVSIPVYRNKYKSQQKEGQLRWQSSKEQFSETFNMLKAELIQTKHLLDNANRQIDLLEKQTTIATSTYRLVVKEYSTGKSDLTTVIQLQRQLLDYRLRKSDAISTYNTLVATAQRLISVIENN